MLLSIHSTNETKGLLQGAAQVINLVKKAKNYTVISAYEYQKEKLLSQIINILLRLLAFCIDA